MVRQDSQKWAVALWRVGTNSVPELPTGARFSAIPGINIRKSAFQVKAAFRFSVKQAKMVNPSVRYTRAARPEQAYKRSLHVLKNCTQF